MKPSEYAKSIGLNSLQDVADGSNTSIQTLNNWSKNKRELFESVCIGVLIRSKGVDSPYLIKACVELSKAVKTLQEQKEDDQ